MKVFLALLILSVSAYRMKSSSENDCYQACGAAACGMPPNWVGCCWICPFEQKVKSEENCYSKGAQCLFDFQCCSPGWCYQDSGQVMGTCHDHPMSEKPDCGQRLGKCSSSEDCCSRYCIAGNCL